MSNKSVARDSAPELVGGPYSRPTYRSTGRAHDLYCIIRGVVRAEGLTAAPIPWPYVRTPRGRLSLLLTGDLVTALHIESVAAIMHHWGVSQTTVMRWRQVLRTNLAKHARRRMTVARAARRIAPRAGAAARRTAAADR